MISATGRVRDIEALARPATSGVSVVNEVTKLAEGPGRAGTPGDGTGAVIARLLYFEVPPAVVWAYVVGMILLYVFVSVHTPITVLAHKPHDDGLFMSLGAYLSEGRWLGPFNQYTLMKGPGYAAFLALNNWLGTPISLSHALFHCMAVTLFAIVAHRFAGSIVLSGLLFTLLLWHPVC